MRLNLTFFKVFLGLDLEYEILGNLIKNIVSEKTAQDFLKNVLLYSIFWISLTQLRFKTVQMLATLFKN